MWFNLLKIDVDRFINPINENHWSLSHDTEYPPRVAMKWLLENIEKLDYASVDEEGLVTLKPSWISNKKLTITKNMFLFELYEISEDELRIKYPQIFREYELFSKFLNVELEEFHLLNIGNEQRLKMKELFYIESFSFNLKQLLIDAYSPNLHLDVNIIGKYTHKSYSKRVCLIRPENDFPTADIYVSIIHLINNKEPFLNMWEG